MSRDLSLEDVDGGVGNGSHASAQVLASKLQRELATISEKAHRRAKASLSADPAGLSPHREGAFERGVQRLLRSTFPTAGLAPSKRLTMPDTGGRSFHFEHVSVRPDSCSLKKGQRLTGNHKVGKSKFAKDITHTTRASVHQRYIVREGAVERLSDPATMQRYIDDGGKTNPQLHGSNGGDEFSFGTPGLSVDDMCEIWELAELHARGEKTPVIQHRMIVELPHEATPLDRIAIMRAFVAPLEQADIPYWVSIHAPTPDNDERNFHAHVIFLNRRAEKIMWPEGGDRDFGNKPDVLTWDFACVTAKKDKHRKTRDRYLKRKKVPPLLRGAWVKEWRHRYAAIVNDQMIKSGKAVRFDPRSYKDAGLVDVVPEKKSGYARKVVERHEPSLDDILRDLSHDARAKAEAEFEDERRKLIKAKAAVASDEPSFFRLLRTHEMVGFNDPRSKRQRAFQLPSRHLASAYLMAEEALIDRQVEGSAERHLLLALAQSMSVDALAASRRRITSAMTLRTPDTRERSRRALEELPDDATAEIGREAVLEVLADSIQARSTQIEDARAAVDAAKLAWRTFLDTDAVSTSAGHASQVQNAAVTSQKPKTASSVEVPGGGAPPPSIFGQPRPQEAIRFKTDERKNAQEKQRAGILANAKAKARRGSDFGL